MLDTPPPDRPLSSRIGRPAQGTGPESTQPAAMSGVETMGNQAGAGGSGSFFRACILLLLSERPSHGYDLLERLTSFGFDSGDSGWLYRTLRTFERDGSVDSTWEISSSGPPRRVYVLTELGTARLETATTAVRASKRAIDDYLARTGRTPRPGGPEERGNAGRT